MLMGFKIVLLLKRRMCVGNAEGRRDGWGIGGW